MPKSELTFRDAGSSPSGKTRRVRVVNSRGIYLAAIAWHAPWRRYTVLPVDGTIWDAGCLREVAAQLDRMMAERQRR